MYAQTSCYQISKLFAALFIIFKVLIKLFFYLYPAKL